MAAMTKSPFDTNAGNDFIPGEGQPPIQKTMRTHFERGDVRKYDLKLSRDTTSAQIKKTCWHCHKGFCRRKGRSKAEPIDNQPGRYICQSCLTKLLNGDSNVKIKICTKDSNNTLQEIDVKDLEFKP